MQVEEKSELKLAVEDKETRPEKEVESEGVGVLVALTVKERVRPADAVKDGLTELGFVMDDVKDELPEEDKRADSLE